jgi:hypothetical protein
VITTGTPAEFEPLFQAHKVGWSTLVCPRLDAEDVKEIFSMNGIEVGDDDTVTSLLLNFSRFGPHGLFTLAEVAAKRQLGVLSVEKARLLADDIDSDAELRRKPPKLTFMSIRSAKPRPRRNAPGQLKMNLGHED